MALNDILSQHIGNGITYFLKHGYPDCGPGKKMYLVNDGKNGKPVDFWLLPNGQIMTNASSDPIDASRYCGELTRIKGKVQSNLLPCLFDSKAGQDYRVQLFYGILFTIGAIFLALTLCIQLALPELRKSVHSNSLIAHIAALLVGYIVLAAGNLRQRSVSTTVCTSMALSIQFTFLAAFFWLNVMCIDIAWTFSGLKAPKGSSIIESDKRKLIYYSLYAWGTSFMVTGLTLVLYLIPGDGNSIFKPKFGERLCWFEDSVSAALYFHLPTGLTMSVNLFLFIYTSIKIIKMRRETSVLSRNESARYEGNRSKKADEHRFLLYLKLFSIMGITWMFEIISWSTNNERRSHWWWYITDTINAMRGVFIFAIFCCKEKIWKLLKTKVFNLFNFETASKGHKRSTSGHQGSSTFSTVNQEISVGQQTQSVRMSSLTSH